jgi:hypothetical protein
MELIEIIDGEVRAAAALDAERERVAARPKAEEVTLRMDPELDGVGR